MKNNGEKDEQQKGFWQDKNCLRHRDRKLCGIIEILGATRSESGTMWGRLVRWKDPEGRSHQKTFQNAQLTADPHTVIAQLSDEGLPVYCDSNSISKIVEYIRTAPYGNIINITDRSGWHGDTYVLPPNRGFSKNGEEIYLMNEERIRKINRYNQNGTLSNWNENVSKYCKNNLNLILSASAGFAGPLLKHFSSDGVGLHFNGASSGGKTTLAHVAGSIWGGGDVVCCGGDETSAFCIRLLVQCQFLESWFQQRKK